MNKLKLNCLFIYYEEIQVLLFTLCITYLLRFCIFFTFYLYSIYYDFLYSIIYSILFVNDFLFNYNNTSNHFHFFNA